METKQDTDQGEEQFDPKQGWVERCTAAECRQPIYWRKHHITGKPAPIDARPSALGNILLNEDQETYTIPTKQEKDAEPEKFAGKLHVNHFATCEQAKRFARLRG